MLRIRGLINDSMLLPDLSSILLWHCTKGQILCFTQSESINNEHSVIVSNI